MKTTYGIIGCSLLLAVVFAGDVKAQIIKPEVVNGNTYTCYFLSTLDIINSDIVFNGKGMMTLTAYAGNGFYVPILESFMGVYWSLNQQIGLNSKGDYLFIISGITADPFITGVGLIIYEYKKIYFTVFFGFRAVTS